MKKIAPVVMILFLAFFYGYGEAGGAKDVPPGAPTILRLVIVSNGFKLTWKLSPEDPGIVNGYEIVRSDRASGPFERVALVGGKISEYIDTTADKETIYYYKVRSKAGKIFSPFSNTVTGER